MWQALCTAIFVVSGLVGANILDEYVVDWFYLGGSALESNSSIDLCCLALLYFLLVLPPVVACVLAFRRFCCCSVFVRPVDVIGFAGSVGSLIDCVLLLALLGKYSKIVHQVNDLEFGGGTSGQAI